EAVLAQALGEGEQAKEEQPGETSGPEPGPVEEGSQAQGEEGAPQGEEVAPQRQEQPKEEPGSDEPQKGEGSPKEEMVAQGESEKTEEPEKTSGDHEQLIAKAQAYLAMAPSWQQKYDNEKTAGEPTLSQANSIDQIMESIEDLYSLIREGMRD